MAKKKSYKNVEEMVRDLSGGSSFADDFETVSRRCQIAHHLFAARSSQGLSQADIARRFGCTQGRISKLENGIDDDIRIGDLRKYLHALDQDMTVVICKKECQSFEQIKCFAFMIQRSLKRLVELAKGDKKIQKGVSNAHLETLVNMVKIVVDSASKLPDFHQDLPGIIEADGEFDHEDANGQHESLRASADKAALSL